MDIQGDVVSALAVSSLATQPRRSLVVDALNKLSYFIPAEGDGDFAGLQVCQEKRAAPLSKHLSPL